MPLGSLYLHVFYDFADVGHSIVKVAILEFEEGFGHSLLLTVLHVDVYQEEAEGN